ncbi:MAG: PLD nuclease N-terminal domain-containing protein [bacterium]
MPEKIWLFVPLIVLQLALLVVALIDLARRKPKGALIWGVVIVLFSIVGPVLYFALGRKGAGDESNE